MHVEQKRSLLHFFGLPPYSCFITVLVLQLQQRTDSGMRIRALCNEIQRVHAVRMQAVMWEVILKIPTAYSTAKMHIGLYVRKYYSLRQFTSARMMFLAMKQCKFTRPNLADVGRIQGENRFCGDLGHQVKRKLEAALSVVGGMEKRHRAESGRTLQL